MLRIHLLGTPAVYDDDRPLQIQRRIQRALLFYLACQRDGASRSELMLLFWPDAPEPDARRHLREALSKLRADLPADTPWVTGRDSIGLDHSRMYVDVQMFYTSIARVWRSIQQIPLQTPLPEPVYRELNAAVRMWRSARFMGGANLPSSQQFDRWLVNVSQELEYLRQRSAERLGYHAAASGDLESGIYYMRLALQSDEVNEGLHLQVLTWLHALGRQSEALEYCRFLEGLFSSEDEVEPSPALLNLCKQIRLEANGRPPEQLPWPLAGGPQVPYVGRAQLLKDLAQHYFRGGSLAILGESGSGKTRLIQQLYGSLNPAPRLLYLQANDSDTRLPYQPLIEMLRSQVTQAEWKDLEPVWLAHLSVLLPELAALCPQPQFPNREQITEARAQLFESIHRLLQQLASGRRILLVLDDAHWSDEATLAVLAYLQENQFFARHGLLVLAARIEERSPALDAFLRRAQRIPRVHLTELLAEDISEMARHVLGRLPSGETVNRLLQNTGGNPLFLLETLRSWLEAAPFLEEDLPAEAPLLPDRIHSLLRERLNRMSPMIREVLNAAAVIGREFSLEVLEAAAGVSPEGLVQAVEELELSGQIRPLKRADAPDSYLFVHDLFREVLLVDLGLARRRLLHLKAAYALEKTLKGQVIQQPAVLAGHYEQAGKPEQAFSYWLQAAEHARKLFSREEAYAAFNNAERLLHQYALRLPDRSVHQLYSSWGDTAYTCADIEGSLYAYQALLRCGEQREAALLLGSAYNGLGMVQMYNNQPERAAACFEQAGAYLQVTGDLSEQLSAVLRQGMLWIMLCRYQDAKNAFRKVISQGRGSLDPRIRATLQEAADWLGMVYNITGWPEKAVSLISEISGEDWRGPSVLQPSGRVTLAVACHFLGRYEDALEHCRAGIATAEALGSRRFAGMLYTVKGRVELVMCRLDDCLNSIERGLEVGRSSSYPEVLGDGYCLQGDFYRMMNEPEQAIRAYRLGMETSNREGYVFLQNKYRLGLVQAVSGQMEEGSAVIGAVADYAREMGVGIVRVPAEMHQAALLIHTGRHEEGRARMLDVIEEARQRRMITVVMISRSTLGELDLQQGRLDDAWGHALGIIQTARAVGNRMQEINGLHLGCRVLRAQGESDTDMQSRLAELIAEIRRYAQLPQVSPLFERYSATFC